MTDRDPPSIGPLSRLRQQLAGPRGTRRIDALLSSDDAAGAVAALSPNEVFELVHEVGFEDAGDLLALATPAQFVGCFDLDGWQKDTLDVVALRPWMWALFETGFEKATQVWGTLDAELRALILQREVKIYDTTLEEGPRDDSDAPIFTTSDRFFHLELPEDDETQRLVIQLVEDLYRGDPDLARHTIMAARSEPPAELEETAYRWRSARLADLGYVDFYEALDLFRPLKPEDVHIGEGSQERASLEEPQQLAMSVAEEVLGRSFLARALAAVDDREEATRLEGALMVLVNKVLAAGRAKPGQPAVIRRGALFATATLSLGPRRRSRAATSRAPRRRCARSASAGCSAWATRSRRACRSSRRRSRHARSPPAARRASSSPGCARRGRCSRAPRTIRPRRACGRSSRRPDLRRAADLLAGLTVRIALVESLGVDLVASGLAPEPRASLDDHVRTALARAVIGGELRGDALSQAELTGAAHAQIRAGHREADRGRVRARARRDPRAAWRGAARRLGGRAREAGRWLARGSGADPRERDGRGDRSEVRRGLAGRSPEILIVAVRRRRRRRRRRRQRQRQPTSA